MPGWDQFLMNALKGVALALERMAVYCVKREACGVNRDGVAGARS